MDGKKEEVMNGTREGEKMEGRKDEWKRKE